jgi:hypothetical protein
MRVLLVVCAMLALSACNWVVTKTPLFNAADAAGAPQLRAGVWAAGPSDNCAFDEAKPMTDWPDCAGRLVVANGRWVMLDRKNGRWTRTIERVVLTGGSPQILQTPPDASGSGADTGFGYYAIKSASRDRSGRVTAFRMWPVLCGPPPPQAKTGEAQPSGSTHPFPGLTMDAGDSDCTTDSREAVRQAADASQLWAADTVLTAHWVRAGDR